jgi:hypothetical protein
MKFHGQGTHADFEYIARYGVYKLFNAKGELETVGYFKQATELHYGLSNFPFSMAKRTVQLCQTVGKGTHVLVVCCSEDQGNIKSPSV